MTTDLVVSSNTLPIATETFGADRLQVLKDIVAKGCSDAEIEAFALVCKRTHLDPFARPPQIYAIKRWDSNLGRKVLTPQASIDSFRLVAARTREYQGQVGPFWCGPDGAWKDIWLADEPPAAARVGVRRKGFPEPIWSVATWKESAQSFKGDNGKLSLGEFWQKMPAHMLAKVAETSALKRAFPNDTEGLELAAIDAELRAQQPEMARKYQEIYGDEEHSYYDLPEPKAPIAMHEGHLVDTGTGEVLDAPAPQTAEEKRARLKVLLASAKERGLHVDMQPPAAVDEDPLDVAIAYWEARIDNFDKDRQAERESGQLL